MNPTNLTLPNKNAPRITKNHKKINNINPPPNKKHTLIIKIINNHNRTHIDQNHSLQIYQILLINEQSTHTQKQNRTRQKTLKNKAMNIRNKNTKKKKIKNQTNYSQRITLQPHHHLIKIKPPTHNTHSNIHPKNPIKFNIETPLRTPNTTKPTTHQLIETDQHKINNKLCTT